MDLLCHLVGLHANGWALTSSGLESHFDWMDQLPLLSQLVCWKYEGREQFPVNPWKD